MTVSRYSLLYGALLGFILVLVFGGILFVVLFFANEYQTSRVLPRVHVVGNTSLSGMTFAEASDELLRTTDSYLEEPLTISYKDQTVSLTPQSLGVRYDIDQTIAPLREVSQSKNYLQKLGVVVRGVEIPYTVTVDKEVFSETLLSSFEFDLSDPVDAEITYSYKAKAFVVEDESIGSTVNAKDLYITLKNQDRKSVV